MLVPGVEWFSASRANRLLQELLRRPRLREAGFEADTGRHEVRAPRDVRALSGRLVHLALTRARVGYVRRGRSRSVVVGAGNSASAGPRGPRLPTTCSPRFSSPAAAQCWCTGHERSDGGGADQAHCVAAGAGLAGRRPHRAACRSGERSPRTDGEPEEFLITRSASSPNRPLRGRRVVVTAGPTREARSVRVLTNRSSGKMGFRRGAPRGFVAPM